MREDGHHRIPVIPSAAAAMKDGRSTINGDEGCDDDDEDDDDKDNGYGCFLRSITPHAAAAARGPLPVVLMKKRSATMMRRLSLSKG